MHDVAYGNKGEYVRNMQYVQKEWLSKVRNPLSLNDIQKRFYNKDKQFFRKHENVLKVQKNVFHTFSTVLQKALIVSFHGFILSSKNQKFTFYQVISCGNIFTR